MMNMQNRITAVLMLAAAFAVMSCKNFHQPELVDVHELLPVDEDVVTVDVTGGEGELKFYSTGRVQAEVLGDISDWAEVTSPLVFEGDGEVKVSFTRNRSYRRMVAIKLTLEGTELTDTLYFRQNGINPELSCDTPYTVVDGSKDTKVTLLLNTNIVRKDLNVEYIYEGEAKDWISGQELAGDIEWDNSDFSFNTKASTLTSTSRAVVHVWFEDGWGENISVDLYLTRTGKDGNLGTPVTMEELRTRTPGAAFASDEYIEGYVVSDCYSRNTAENANTSYDTVDEYSSARTAYVQSADGEYGLRLIFDDAKDNVLKHGMYLSLMLSGTELVRNDAPERYTLEGIDPTNLLQLEGGNDILPEKKTIAELTDADIYTYVSLQNTEFVNKDGAYINICEGYSYFDGWAALLADADGNAIYAPVNHSCDWRRTGNGVPQGVGETVGVIVSEKLKRLGNPGRYQIRVLDEDGFAQSSAAESSYSTLVRWGGAKIAETAASSPLSPSAGTGSLVSENTADNGVAEPVRPTDNLSGTTMAYSGKIANRAISYQLGLEGWYRFTEDGSAINGYNGLVAEFPTSEVSGSGLLAYVSFLAWGTKGTYRVAPAHWCLEYSLDSGATWTIVPAAVSGKEYVHLRPGLCPEDYHNGRKYYPSTSMAAGFCDNVFALPATVLGKESVSVRFRPYDDVLFDFPSEPSSYDMDIETNIMSSSIKYAGDIHFAEISFRVLK